MQDFESLTGEAEKNRHLGHCILVCWHCCNQRWALSPHHSPLSCLKSTADGEKRLRLSQASLSSGARMVVGMESLAVVPSRLRGKLFQTMLDTRCTIIGKDPLQDSDGTTGRYVLEI